MYVVFDARARQRAMMNYDDSTIRTEFEEFDGVFDSQESNTSQRRVWLIIYRDYG